MRFQKLLVLFLLLAGYYTSKAQTTFTVTNNADSGPGTLRQGLLDAAAGAATRTGTFSIVFQLPGDGNDHANRTIRLRTALPNVTSNVIIDGSSQTSFTPLGISGARIILEPEYANTTFSALRIGESSPTGVQTEAVEIYGLFIRNFAVINNFQNVNTNQGSGIVIDYRSNNITIGAPGKGNVISGNIYGILMQNSNFYTTVNPTKIRIQSNLIGLLHDGVTARPNVMGISASLYDCAIDIGGDNVGEGNTIAGNRINIDLRRVYSNATRFDVNVVNNKIGVDYTGLKDFHDLPLFLSSSSLEISGLKVDAVNTQLYVRNNIIGGNRTWGVQITNADFVLTGNAIGTDPNGTVALGNGIGVKLENNSTGTIGGGATNEKNIIAHNNYGVETVSAKAVKITRNSFFCNKTFGIGKTLTILQPAIQVLKRNANYISGKATPNAEVELFYSNNCNGICEGKTYITTVQTGSDGKWEYNGPLSGYVTATASLLNATTSSFATAELSASEYIVTPVTCSGNGSITILENREGFTFSWTKIESNGSRIAKGTSQSLSNLDVGLYEVVIDDGCKAFATQFEIKDQKLTKPVIDFRGAQCGENTFQLSALVLRGNGTIRYEWYKADDLNTVFRTGMSVNVPEGKYVVKATDASIPSCALFSEEVDIARKPQPRIKVAALLTSATCGLDNGSITRIDFDDITGTARYEWYKFDTATGTIGTDVLSTDRELKDQATGNYYIKVYDNGTCSPVTFGPYYIGISNSVTIGRVTPVPARCGMDNGSIPNPPLANANYYEWRNPDGTLRISGTYSTGMSIALDNLAAGTYTLIAKNTANSTCATTVPFIVNAILPKVFTYNTPVINKTSCGVTDNGSIDITFTGSDKPISYQWRDEQGTLLNSTNSIIAGTTALKNLQAGNYYLSVKDVNGCEIPTYEPFTVGIIPLLSIVPNTGSSVSDKCNLNRGSVSGVQVVGGLPPYRFTWIDEHNVSVGNAQDLVDKPAGTYRLKIEDQTQCGLAVSQVYTIVNEALELQVPHVEDVRVCYVSDITVSVIGAQEGIYQLFADPAASAPLLESKNGVFNFKVSKTADYYIRRTLGSCIGGFSKMHVEVTHDNLELGNVITPNGDGLNDTWMVKGLPDYKGNNIKIYTRSGQLVYEAVGNYVKPFDGRFRGADLPAGVYFYVIDLRAECKPISGSITLLR